MRSNSSSSIKLETKDVRVERVQDISEEDAIAEGCQGTEFMDSNGEPKCYDIEPKEQFAALWESINAKRPGCLWEDNPWVWVVEFKIIEKLSQVTGVEFNEAVIAKAYASF